MYLRLARIISLAALLPAFAWAQESNPTPATTPTSSPTKLPEVKVEAEAEYQGEVQSMFLPDVQDTQIFSGKKASVLDFDALPKIQGNNYRQALALTPGLLISEESSPLVSLGYRGIGEPHRAQFFNVLKDGIPIHADPFGYPEAYYTPPLDVVDRVEFVRGGASLMYGPQPAGSINYVTYAPRRDKALSARTQHIFGSDGLYNTYSSFDGTVGRVGYLGYYNHRESDGFREANSDYVLDGGAFKLVVDADKATRYTFNVDAYTEEHGEPGDLTYAQYVANRNQTIRRFDEFRLQRYNASIAVDHDFSEDTLLSVKTWGGYYDRWSRRGAAVPVRIEQQEFYTLGTEARVRHHWDGWGERHTFAGGIHLYASDSPRTDRDGFTLDAEEGLLRADSQRSLLYGSFFFENRFVFGKFSVTPGFRLENINQDVNQQNFNAGGVFTSQVGNSKFDVQPLVAVSSAYETTASTSLYASIAQSYRTTIFTQSLIPPTGLNVNGDIDPSIGWTYEVGWRGTHRDWLTFDTSLFLVDLDNKVGVVGGNISSVGRSINKGWDAAVELDVVRLYDQLASNDLAPRYGSVSLYGNVSLLDAKIHGGTADGFTPQYAPDHMIRTGAIYRLRDRVKVAMLGTFLADHFASDNNAVGTEIPAYMVWDLTAEWKVYKDYVSLVGGINNLLDEDYYSRVRGTLIDPAYGRNYYGGISLSF
jgi:Fe(3+) dicitrate transport protein